jgi:NADP-dependent 3-hydroxy acid dehydrogenase YdfG
MSKFALEGFSQSLREELREQKVRVINIYAGATKTDLWQAVPGDWPKDRMLAPGDVASAVCYAVLSPPDAAVENIHLGHITGKL